MYSPGRIVPSGFGNFGPQQESRCLLIDFVVDEDGLAGVWVAVLAFDGEADRNSGGEQRGCLAASSARGPQVQPHRVELLDRDQLGQAGVADQVAHLDFSSPIRPAIGAYILQ